MCVSRVPLYFLAFPLTQVTLSEQARYNPVQLCSLACAAQACTAQLVKPSNLGLPAGAHAQVQLSMHAGISKAEGKGQPKPPRSQPPHFCCVHKSLHACTLDSYRRITGAHGRSQPRPRARARRFQQQHTLLSRGSKGCRRGPPLQTTRWCANTHGCVCALSARTRTARPRGRGQHARRRSRPSCRRPRRPASCFVCVICLCVRCGE